MAVIEPDAEVLAEAYAHLRRGSGAVHPHHMREVLRDLDRRIALVDAALKGFSLPGAALEEARP